MLKLEHILVECNPYKEIRRRLIPKYFWARPSMYKVVALFTTENSSLLNRLPKYVYTWRQKTGKCRVTMNRGNAITRIANLISFPGSLPQNLCISVVKCISSPGCRVWNRCFGTQRCVNAHKMIDGVHWEIGHPWMKSADARSAHECVPTTYPYAPSVGC